MSRQVGDQILYWTGHAWLLDGMCFEEKEIDTDVPEALRGRTIVEASFDIGDGFGNDLTLRLDNGVVIRISGWGHDWWGTSVLLVEPKKICHHNHRPPKKKAP